MTLRARFYFPGGGLPPYYRGYQNYRKYPNHREYTYYKKRQHYRE